VVQAAEIVVVEGEKCCDALAAHGYTTTTSSHGAKSAAKTDWTPLAGKNVAILPDHDAPGEGYAVSVLQELSRLDPRPRVKIVRLPDLADGEDAADWLSRIAAPQPGDGVNSPTERIKSTLRVLVQSAPWLDLDAVPEDPRPGPAEPKPTPEDALPAVLLPEWPSPPEDAAYKGLAGEVVKRIEPCTEADPVGVLLQFLIGFGNALGSGLSVVADGQDHHANEFGVLVGDTSRSRKGTAWRRVRAVLSHVDADWHDAKITGGLSSGEGLVFEIRDASDTDVGVTDKRLLLVESEFGNVLRVLAREGSTLSGVLRKAWDADTLRTLVKHSPARATNPHVSLIGHITAEELTKYLSHVEIFNGLGNRVLWGCVRRSKRLPFGGCVPGLELVRLGQRLGTAADAARRVGEMTWTDAARRLWEAEYDTLTADRPGLWGAITSRAEAHVLRLSLLYAALDGVGEIADTHVLAALAVWRYCDRSARYLFGGSVGDRNADAILAALRAKPEGMTRTEIRDGIFQRNTSAEDIVHALALLLRYGLVRREAVETPGRPAERWYAYAKNAVNAESPPR
jgi:hypothetical protein